MTLAHKRVQVARPTVENSLAQGVVGMALPAINGGTRGQYYLMADDEDDLEKRGDLRESELHGLFLSFSASDGSLSPSVP